MEGGKAWEGPWRSRAPRLPPVPVVPEDIEVQDLARFRV